MHGRALEALRALGLTDYQARAYLALVRHGELDARTLSALSGIPYSKIYNVLEELRQAGWISTRPGRPKKYVPRPPLEAARSARMRREAELRELEATVVEELQPLYERSKARERPDIWIIRGREEITSKVREALSRATVEVLMAVPSHAHWLVEELKPSIIHLRFSGLNIRVLASEDLKEALSDLEGLVELRFRPGMFGGGIISDAREAILVLGAGGSTMAIWSDYAELAHVAKVYFEHLWSGG